MDSCQSLLKQLTVTNFLYDLTPYLNDCLSLPFFTEGGEDLLMMSSLFCFTLSSASQHGSKIQEVISFLEGINFQSSKFSVINLLLDCINYHSFYLETIAVPISLVIFTYMALAWLYNLLSNREVQDLILDVKATQQTAVDDPSFPPLSLSLSLKGQGEGQGGGGGSNILNTDQDTS